MRVLAIETVGTTGSVAALDDERLLAEHQLDPRRRSAQSLAPGIEGLLQTVGWRPAEVELVAVATGPGSFTGLRIGVTTAKAFAYATGCQVVGVHTMQAIAERVPTEIDRFSVIVDAQRAELFVADFQRARGGTPAGAETTRLLPASAWLEQLEAGQWLTGPALEKWSSRVVDGVRLVEPALWSPTAAAVGIVGRRNVAEGRGSDLFALAVEYLRRTAAEEQWDRKQSGGAAR